jgi:hypothetical protein
VGHFDLKRDLGVEGLYDRLSQGYGAAGLGGVERGKVGLGLLKQPYFD